MYFPCILLIFLKLYNWGIRSGSLSKNVKKIRKRSENEECFQRKFITRNLAQWGVRDPVTRFIYAGQRGKGRERFISSHEWGGGEERVTTWKRKEVYGPSWPIKRSLLLPNEWGYWEICLHFIVEWNASIVNMKESGYSLQPRTCVCHPEP